MQSTRHSGSTSFIPQIFPELLPARPCQTDKVPSLQGENFLIDLGIQRRGSLPHGMPTFLPALLGLHLPRLLTACGMAICHAHFIDGMAEAQREEGIPLSHTACQQRSWDLNHPPWSLFTRCSASMAETNQDVSRKGKPLSRYF